jgi:hypothetical protein
MLCTLVLAAAPMFAADVDGKWSGNIDTPNGAVAVACSLKADGTVLSGTMTGPDGAEMKITDGKIEGNRFTFSMTLDFGGMQVALTYVGVVSGTDLKLATEFFGMPFEIALKKAA